MPRPDLGIPERPAPRARDGCGRGLSAMLALLFVILALGGIARVGQLQLLQPFIGLTLTAVLLHEPVAWTMIGSAAVVVLCVAGARRFA